MRIGRLREEDMNEYGRKVCPRWKKLVNNAVNDDDDDDDEDDEGHDAAGNESRMSLQHMKQKEMEEEGNSDTNDQDASISATTAATSDVNEKDTYIMKDLIVYMIEEAGKIFTMSEKICNFTKQKI
ncbi:hypothetical protein PV328_001163 [Microctonus aethiopoides]|uniref:Uncharacterized protein n=1 Tax=Microctonus aethiopoides TaxID=144406 RepID=A0AA39KX72_9HYME|nr:hypothetical protein PV328_001163 [Microctonus aethiopoides]